MSTTAARDVETARAIERAVPDHFEGWFDGDVERMERALHPDLLKRLTRQGEGKAVAADRRLDIEIEDVHALWQST